MSLTISSGLVGNSANGFRSIAFRDIGSAASRVVSSNASVMAAGDYIAITAGSRLSAQSAGHNQGIANAAEALSLLQVADDALGEIDVKLARMEQLAADASQIALSTTNPAPHLVSERDRAIMNAEFATLRAEIETIATDTSFEDTRLLDGLTVSFALGGGGTSGDSITITLASAKVADLAAGLDTADISTNGDAAAALTIVVSAIGAAGEIRTAVRGAQERFDFATGNLAFGASVVDAERAIRLTPEVTLDISHLAANQLLDARGIDELTRNASLKRALLTGVVNPKTTDSDTTGAEAGGGAKSASSVPNPVVVSGSASGSSSYEPQGQSVSFTV